MFPRLSCCLRVALRKESVDRNARFKNCGMPLKWSLSARRAWIEIGCKNRKCTIGRAWIEIGGTRTARCGWIVALRKESVDRNRLKHPGGRLEQVALRKESVDRNVSTAVSRSCSSLSLSARRAWIEITLLQQQELLSLTLLSARRAWNVSLSDCSGRFCSCGYPL